MKLPVPSLRWVPRKRKGEVQHMNLLLNPLKRIQITEHVYELSHKREALKRQLEGCQHPRSDDAFLEAFLGPMYASQLALMNLQIQTLQEQEIALLFLEFWYDALIQLSPAHLLPLRQPLSLPGKHV